MGLSESSIKTLTEPITHLIDNCGHSDFKSKCCECFQIEIDTRPIDALPVLSNLQTKDNSRESDIRITSSSITKIVEKA
jgi:hypothetical protein